MTRTLGLAVLALALATAGCIGSQVPADEAEETIEEQSEDLPVTPPTEGERGLEEPPTLREGEWWDVQLSSDVYGVDASATIVVAGVENGSYMVGMPSEDFVHEALILHLPALGPVFQDTLGYESHDRPYEPLNYPLEEGKTWTTEWYTGDLDAEVVEASPDEVRVELRGGATINVTHEPGLGLPRATEVAGYGSYEVTDHGYGFEGDVKVPWNHDVIFLNGRVGPAADLSLNPAPPVESIEVSGPYDGASIALLMGNVLADGPPGAYRVAADSPAGETYEESFVVQPTGPQLHMAPFGTDDPTGTWDVEYEAGGPGVAAIEGLGYEVLERTLPSDG